MLIVCLLATPYRNATSSRGLNMFHHCPTKPHASCTAPAIHRMNVMTTVSTPFLVLMNQLILMFAALSLIMVKHVK
jgi:hypothetical protein